MHGADERTGGRALTRRSGGRADGAERAWTVGRTRAERVRTVERTGGRGPRSADTRTGKRGADRAQHARTSGRADWAVGASIVQTAGRADGRTGADRRTSSLPVGRMGERAGGPGFKRPHSTRLGSLLGAQSACLVRVRVRRVPGSAVGSNTIPRQTPVLSTRTHLPCLSASVLGAEKGILLFRYKNGFIQGRW